MTTAIELPYTKRTLANGLDVVVHEARHVPIVAVNLWYHVGSKNERPGRTGFAHLFEHLMFEGSEHHNTGFFMPLQQAGALLNGSTNTDRTNYWEVVPTAALELALWMESDRMGYLLPALTRERFETQRDVVLNERRQNYENRPYGLAMMALTSALYPPDHPYHWLTIGAADDIRAMQFEDVQAFFRAYYHPGNASLALAGDIDTAQAFELADKYFGEIPAGAPPPPVDASATLSGEVRLVLEDRVELPRIYMAWHSPAMFAAGDAEADLLADLLANGKTSRLYRTLVYDERVSLDVSAYQHSRELGSFFLLASTAAPGPIAHRDCRDHRPEDPALAEDGPDGRRDGAGLAQAEAHFMYRLQTVGGFGGKSDQLNTYNVFRGDPDFLCRRPRALSRRHEGHRPARGARAPGLRPARPPERRAARPVGPRASGFGTGVGLVMRADRSRLPAPGPDPPFHFPSIVRHTLKNGLKVRTVEHHNVPVLTFVMEIDGGLGADPAGKEGLASITADMVDEGTGDLSAIDVSDALARIGAEYDVEVGADATMFTLTTLTRFAARGAGLLSNILTKPTLRESDFERVRQLRLDRLTQLKDLAPAVADRAFLRLLSGSHPYGHLAIGTDAALRALAPRDVERFHLATFLPWRATLVVTGAMSHDELLAVAQEAFGGWSGDEAICDLPHAAADLTPEDIPSAILAIVEREAAAQSELRIGHLSARRNTPDYAPLQVMNAVLGGQFVSRINLKLREEKAFTYGVRTGFDWRRGLGPFSVQTSVHTAATAEAIGDSLAEIAGIRGARPPTEQEMSLAKASLTRGYPRNFETAQQVARSVAQLALFDLPDTYFEEFVPKVNAVTVDDVTRAAQTYLDPARAITLVVGDLKATEASLRALDLGELQVLSAQ